MYRRAYAIELKPDLPEETIAAFVDVLRRAPEFMPTLVHSRVAVEVTDYMPWDLVWDNAFTDEAGFWEYVNHPYHCNVIDQYMYREHPDNVVKQIYSLRWDDSAPMPAGVPTEDEVGRA